MSIATIGYSTFCFGVCIALAGALTLVYSTTTDTIKGSPWTVPALCVVWAFVAIVCIGFSLVVNAIEPSAVK